MIILAISGKRKSGKDYCARKLKEMLEEKSNKIVEISGISYSLKKEFAEIHGIQDFQQLLTDGPYKEKYRKEMILWGEEKRRQDATVFCRSSLNFPISHPLPEIVIISDCRRPSDLHFFKTNYSTLTIRIETGEEDRTSRGFKFVEGIDDADSECALDNYRFFDFRVENLNSEEAVLDNQLDLIVKRVMNV